MSIAEDGVRQEGAADRRVPWIDAHVHAFPDRLAQAVRDHMNRRGELQGSPLLPAVAQGVRDAGFAAAWILPYAHRAGVAERANEWSAAAVAGYPWLVAGATFHPDDPGLERLVERALVELRLRVVKLHCSVGRFSPADPRLGPLWRTAARLGAPVVTHAGQRSAGETAAEEVDELIPVLRAHPDLRLIVAHSGHPHTERTLQLMASFPNLYGDLTPVWLSPVQISAEMLTRFAGRLLFGSDAPNCPTSARELAARIEGMGLDAAALAALLGGTAQSLIPLTVASL